MKKYYDVFYTKNSKKREKVLCRTVLASNKDEAIKKVAKWSSGTTKQQVLTASFSTTENDCIEHLQGEIFSSVQELEQTMKKMLGKGLFSIFKNIEKNDFVIYFDGSTHSVNCIEEEGELKVIHAK